MAPPSCPKPSNGHAHGNKQIIHTKLTVRDNRSTFLSSFIYGFNSVAERVVLWADLVRISSSTQAIPWILQGDFNVVQSNSKKIGGDLSWAGHMGEMETTIFRLNWMIFTTLATRWLGLTKSPGISWYQGSSIESLWTKNGALFFQGRTRNSFNPESLTTLLS